MPTLNPLYRSRFTAGYRLLRARGLADYTPEDGVDGAIEHATDLLFAVGHVVYHARGEAGVPRSWIYNHGCYIGPFTEELIGLLFDGAVTGDDLIAWGNTLARAVTILETLEDKA